MDSTAYQSVNNVDIERPPNLEYEAVARQLPSDGRRDSNFDADCGLDPEVDGGGALSSEPESEKHTSYFELGPGFVSQESWVIRLFSWTWEIILTTLPLFFICTSILALKLDAQAKSTSTYGGKLEEISSLSPTIYPILFAMVAGRFYKNVARWRLERPYGITVSSLEQIIGSQSFASALERFIVIRARLLIGALILSSWAMSPLGGQSSSRLLRVDKMKSEIHEWVYYDIRTHQNSIFRDVDYYTRGEKDVITGLYSASLLSPGQQRTSSMDLWGRPRIPQWPGNSTKDAVGARREFDKNTREAESDYYYTSLIGVNMQGLDLDDNSTHYEFEMDSDYIDFDCYTAAETKSRQDLEKVSFPQHRNSTDSNLWEAFGASRASKVLLPSFVPILVYPGNFSTSPYLLYSSRGPENQTHYYVFNCTTTTISLRTSLLCTAQGCLTQHQSLIKPMDTEFKIRPYWLQDAFKEWPKVTPGTDRASPTDNYIANQTTYWGQKMQNWAGIDTKMFSKRLTTAFNTIWDAGKDSYNLTKSSLVLTGASDASWTNRTRATITKTEEAYYVNRLWATALIVTTSFLQALAICGLVLKCLIRGPDILGFASSLTRDNAFVPVLGGSFQGGAERARALRNMRVQLADVQPREIRGYIALSTVSPATSARADNDEDKKESPRLGQLEKKRMYI